MVPLEYPVVSRVQVWNVVSRQKRSTISSTDQHESQLISMYCDHDKVWHIVKM